MKSGQGGRAPWYTKKGFTLALQGLGIIEVLTGAFVLLSRHQGVQGYGFLILGVIRFLAGPWLARKRPKFNF